MLASDTEYKTRMATCKGCRHFIRLTTTCKRCGCFMVAKAKLKNAKCPDGKWGSTQNSWG